jgi:acetyl esterase/lipase
MYPIYYLRKKGGAEDEHFMPRNSKLKQLPVLIFVHGGYWNSGRGLMICWAETLHAKE